MKPREPAELSIGEPGRSDPDVSDIEDGNLVRIFARIEGTG